MSAVMIKCQVLEEHLENVNTGVVDGLEAFARLEKLHTQHK